MSIAQQMIQAAETLRDAVAKLHFDPPVAYVYNPLDYAWAGHESYLRRYANSPKKVVFLGMNPGPFGMAQTGVPFGEIPAARDWMKIEVPIGKPKKEHPKRPVEGFACKKSEVSGRRLYGLFAKRYPNAADFFVNHFVANYCPLAFMEASGLNRTPDKLPANESAPLEESCQQHLRAVLRILQPEWVIGIGQFAAQRAAKAAVDGRPKVETILHPSPANPAANRNWSGIVETKLVKLGVWEN